MTFEDRKKIYTEHLDALSEFPVWTIDQIKEFLHLDFDTVQKFVAAKWLYKFNVGRCTFYSCNNKKFTNQAIIKSVMMIDTHYYINEKVINKSEHIGILYWLDEDEKKFVKDFEDEHNAVVYHIVKTITTIGCMLSVFYVSDDESEWESDREDIENGEQLCYVKNIDNEDCSEFGFICFKKSFGGLVRTA